MTEKIGRDFLYEYDSWVRKIMNTFLIFLLIYDFAIWAKYILTQHLLTYYLNHYIDN